MEIVKIGILFIPREGAVQTAVVQKFPILFCCYTLPAPFTGSLLGQGAPSLSVPLPRAAWQKDVRVVFFVCDVGACLLKPKQMWKEFGNIYL